MTRVAFDVTYEFDASSRQVWDALVDWKGHEKWIPATRVETDEGDLTEVGATFTAWTGVGRLSLEDRMRVTSCTWVEETRTGYCEVEKLGPVLQGRAGFTVQPDSPGARVEWFEDVTVPRLPAFLAPVVGRGGAFGFRMGMRRLDRLLGSSGAGTV